MYWLKEMKICEALDEKCLSLIGIDWRLWYLVKSERVTLTELKKKKDSQTTK